MRRWVWSLPLVLALGSTAHAETITVLAGNQGPEIIGAAIKAFEQEHPDIQVDLMLEAWDTVDDKFSTLVAAGKAPDVFINNSVYGWAKYAYQGLFMDLQPLVRRDKADLRYDEFFPAAIEQSKIGGHLYGMPSGPATGFATTYNATLFEQAGLATPSTAWDDPSWNWDTMVAAAKKLTKVGADGTATQYGVDFWDGDGPLLATSYAFGGDWFDPKSYDDGIVNEVTLNTPANARAFQAVADLRTKSQVRPGGPLGGVGAGIDNFGNGKIAMWLEITQYNPGTFAAAAQYKWGFAPFPYPVGSDRGRISSWGGGGFAAIPTGSKHTEAAWTFLKWAVSSDRRTHPALNDWVSVGGPRSTWFAAQDEWYAYHLSSQSKADMLQVLQGAVTHAAALPRQTIAGASEVWDVVIDELGDALHGEEAAQTALARAQAKATAAVAQLKEQLQASQ